MVRKLTNTQVEVPDDIINLGVGHPGWSALPQDLLRQAADHRLSQTDKFNLIYGPEQGDGEFLIQLAAFLSDGYGLPTSPHNLMVTGGASQALEMICTTYTQPGDTVFVEEPTYFVAPMIFREHKLNIVGIPTDENGIDVDKLEALLESEQPRFVYTIPVHQNPGGVTQSTERRKRLVELSQAHNFFIVADEVYQLLTYSGTPPAPFAAYVDKDTVISVGSFSKILAPGLRLGWIQAHPTILDKFIDLGFLFSGGSINHFVSHIVRSALELGLQSEHLAELVRLYRSRNAALCQALRDHLGHLVEFEEPAGGFFVWARFPESFDTKALLKEARKNHVAFQPGVNFSSSGGQRNYMRFCFTRYDEAELAEGIRRLAAVLPS